MTQSIDPQLESRDASSAPSDATASPSFTRFSMRRVALFIAVCLVVFLVSASQSFADTITGTVTDPSGAVVAGAQVEISGNMLPQKLVLTTDAAGKFAAANLAAGKYSVRVSRAGFDDSVQTIDLKDKADIQLTMTLAAQQTSVNVSAQSLAFANSDSAYRQLRQLGLGNTYKCENFTLTMDVGTFELKSGTVTFLGLVNRFQTGAIFVGQGHFTLKAVTRPDKLELSRRSGGEVVEEDISEAMFRFTGKVYAQFAQVMGSKVDTPPQAAAAFEHWKNKLRHRNEVPEGMTQALLESESIDNVDADVLAAIYNPKHPAFFNAYMAGSPHKDLRFFVRARVGAIQQIDSPEEVALINCNGGGMDDGIWYSQHFLAELKAQTASSSEDRRLYAVHRYNIETVIAKNNHMFSKAKITFAALVDGERVMKFGLLPTLRVSRVTSENGKDLHFIQEDKKSDGSFYAVLDEPAEIGKERFITVEYGGDKVLENAGDGSYYIGARESWYPNLNGGGFGEKAIYDLTFKIPHSNTLISVGKLEGESTEAGFAVTHWVTPVPVAVAGFNYGQYKKTDVQDSITHYNISGYYLTEIPNALKDYVNTTYPGDDNTLKHHALEAMSPGAMTKYALDQTRAQMQLCTFYFGKAPYENVAITEQPNFNFGQSWPSLVYLPISAYIDSTQRWMLFNHIDTNFTGFVQEVTPHEVAHQWFGHGVGWASYHDQWLSEGFADFAAGLFLEEAVGPKWQKDYLEYWHRQHQRIVEKNNFGIAPNDAGPLWLGIRLVSPKSPQAYQGVTYSKGAYILQMLRSLMYDDQAENGKHDQAFIDMMHDFMDSHKDKPASTESFKAIVEKHITKRMDLQHNGRLDWFFDEWVYGTHVPRYAFKYEMQPGKDGKQKIHCEVTQSEVDDHFAMLVPVFADFGEGLGRMGQVGIVGNSTRSFDFIVDRAPKKVALNAYKDVLER